MAAERDDDGVVRAWGGGSISLVLGVLAVPQLLPRLPEVAARSVLALDQEPLPVARGPPRPGQRRRAASIVTRMAVG